MVLQILNAEHWQLSTVKQPYPKSSSGPLGLCIPITFLPSSFVQDRLFKHCFAYFIFMGCLDADRHKEEAGDEEEEGKMNVIGRVPNLTLVCSQVKFDSKQKTLGLYNFVFSSSMNFILHSLLDTLFNRKAVFVSFQV